MSLRLLSFLPLAAALIANAACAQSAAALLDDYRRVYAEGQAVHTLDIDNDSLLLRRDDGFYSSGLRYAYARTVSTAEEMRAAGWRIGQDLYTASDIKLPPALVGPPDRPYAGWLYGGVFHHVHRADGTHTRLGLDVGCLGHCAGGEWTQTRFHRLLDQPEPRGWSRQVGNEWGAVLYADIAPVRWKPASHVDLTPNLHARFGNIFTDIRAGLTLRAGRLDELPGQRAFYGFLRADTKVVGYDATLQGGYFSNNSPHTVEPKRVTGEIELGAVWADGPYALRIGLIRRANEVRALPNSSGAQNFLRLQFVYAH
jgi:lipid A 3-O-deacylase